MNTGRSDDSVQSVYDEHVWDVYGYIGYRVRSREEAEDLTQATFERAVRSWSRFDPARASPRTWLLTIAHNLVVDHHRRGRAVQWEPAAIEAHLDGMQEPHYSEAGLGLGTELSVALSQLTEREREVIALRFGGDLTGAQIAEVMDLTTSNVQQILSRALRRLRTQLGAKRPAESGGRSA